MGMVYEFPERRLMRPRKPMSQEVAFDDMNDIVTVCGIRINGDFFRSFGEVTPPEYWMQVRKIEDGVATMFNRYEGLRSSSEYWPDMGAVTWWHFPKDGSSARAWIGTPEDAGWHAHFTHFTPHPEIPREPA